MDTQPKGLIQEGIYNLIFINATTKNTPTGQKLQFQFCTKNQQNFLFRTFECKKTDSFIYWLQAFFNDNFIKQELLDDKQALIEAINKKRGSIYKTWISINRNKTWNNLGAIQYIGGKNDE